MYRMFSNTSKFNQPLNNWNVCSVADMNEMFYEAESFNQSLDKWDTSSVIDMRDMFNGSNMCVMHLNKLSHWISA